LILKKKKEKYFFFTNIFIDSLKTNITTLKKIPKDDKIYLENFSSNYLEGFWGIFRLYQSTFDTFRFIIIHNKIIKKYLSTIYTDLPFNNNVPDKLKNFLKLKKEKDLNKKNEKGEDVKFLEEDILEEEKCEKIKKEFFLENYIDYETIYDDFKNSINENDEDEIFLKDLKNKKYYYNEEQLKEVKEFCMKYITSNITIRNSFFFQK